MTHACLSVELAYFYKKIVYHVLSWVIWARAWVYSHFRGPLDTHTFGLLPPLLQICAVLECVQPHPPHPTTPHPCSPGVCSCTWCPLLFRVSMFILSLLQASFNTWITALSFFNPFFPCTYTYPRSSPLSNTEHFCGGCYKSKYVPTVKLFNCSLIYFYIMSNFPQIPRQLI